jgi:hypothetical protein
VSSFADVRNASGIKTSSGTTCAVGIASALTAMRHRIVANVSDQRAVQSQSSVNVPFMEKRHVFDVRHLSTRSFRMNLVQPLRMLCRSRDAEIGGLINAVDSDTQINGLARPGGKNV